MKTKYVSKFEVKKYLLIGVIIYLISLLYLLFLNPMLQKQNTSNVVSIIYFLLMSFCILFFTNIFDFNIGCYRDAKNSDKNFNKKRIAVITIFSLIVIGKILLGFWARDFVENNLSTTQFIFSIIKQVFVVVAEEYLFTGLLYEGFREKKIPYALNIIIVSLLFAITHYSVFANGFDIINLSAIFLIRFIILLGYKLFPFIPFYCVFHFLWNFGSLIVML